MLRAEVDNSGEESGLGEIIMKQETLAWIMFPLSIVYLGSEMG